MPYKPQIEIDESTLEFKLSCTKLPTAFMRYMARELMFNDAPPCPSDFESGFAAGRRSFAREILASSGQLDIMCDGVKGYNPADPPAAPPSPPPSFLKRLRNLLLKG